MLYQSGYLTIKGYDQEYNEYMLDYPNDEVRKGFMTLMANSFWKKAETEPDNWVKNLSCMFNSCNLTGVNISSESRTVEEWIAE